MSTAIHIDSGDGGTKCGCNVIYDFYPGGYNAPKVDPPIRKIARRMYVYFEDPAKGREATCKRCLNKVARPTVIEITEDLNDLFSGKKVFHYSFGYDMTLNVFAKPIHKTAKGLICREIGWEYVGSKSVKPIGSFATDSKPFLMTRKRSAHGSEYFTGNGQNWYIVDSDKTFYENHDD